MEKEQQWKLENDEVLSEDIHAEEEKTLAELQKSKLTKLFEYNFISFMVEQNCSLIFSEELFKFLKRNLKDSEMIGQATAYRKIVTLLITDCFKPIIQEEIEKKIEGKFFSLMIDETTDKSKNKYLAIVLQFWDEVKGGPKCILHSLINCSNKQNSDEIFRILDENILQKLYGKKLVGFGSDGASVLRGKNHSVLQMLKAQIPQIWDMHCLSHCFNRVTEYACTTLPNSIEILVKSIYNYFSHSSISVAEWLELQEFMNLKPYKIISWGATRWSSYYEAINRIYIRWDALITYFTSLKGDSDAHYIVKKMIKPHIKVYIQFLQIFLEKIHILNKRFQKQISQITTIESIITDFYNSIINILLKAYISIYFSIIIKHSYSRLVNRINQFFKINFFTLWLRLMF